jgi:hypothetical protein
MNSTVLGFSKIIAYVYEMVLYANQRGQRGMQIKPALSCEADLPANSSWIHSFMFLLCSSQRVRLRTIIQISMRNSRPPVEIPSGNLLNKYIVTRRPIAMEQLGKQTLNKYSTKNRVDPFLGNTRNTSTQQWNRCCKKCFLCGIVYIHC